MNGAASRFSWPRASRARSSRSTKSGCGRRCAVSILHSRSWLTSTSGANCRNERPAARRRARSSAPNSVSAVSRGSDWRRAGRTRQLLPHTIRLTSGLTADTVGMQCQPSLTPLQRRGGQCRVGYTNRGGCLQPSAGVGDPFLYERLARGAIFECLEQALETVGVAGTDCIDVAWASNSATVSFNSFRRSPGISATCAAVTASWSKLVSPGSWRDSGGSVHVNLSLSRPRLELTLDSVDRRLSST